jgi:hypothetical protein
VFTKCGLVWDEDLAALRDPVETTGAGAGPVAPHG